MDPRSVILVMALNLLFTGGLFLLIARQMPPRQGVDAFGAGAAVFGAAYLARLILGLSTGGPVALMSDLCMVGAALLFLSGLGQVVGRPALRLRQGQWALFGEHGLILKRGHDLGAVLAPVERRLMKLVAD